jgi:phage tail-like protein
MPEAYPVTKYRFSVTSGGFDSSFMQVTGLREEIEVVDMRDGTDPLQIRKIPGLRQGGEVTFVKGVVTSPAQLVEWFRAVKRLDKGFRKTIKIEVRGREGPQPASGHSPPKDGAFVNLPIPRAIELQGAWPSAYEMGDLDARESDVALESLTVVFENMKVSERNTAASS